MTLTADSFDNLVPLKNQPVQLVFSNLMQVTDMILWTIRQVGAPAKLYMTSFSISEEFVRRLFFMMERDKLVSEAHLVLDTKATEKTKRIWIFIHNVFSKVWLASNHSKMFIVEGTKGKALINTSQNLTRGNRFESSIITSDKSLVDHAIQKFNSLTSQNSIALHDIFE